jgi:TolB-like protein
MNPGTDLSPEARQKRKKDKLRSAWISFVGRIVAQVIGAIASVALGYIVLTKYGFPDRASTKSDAATPAAASGRPVPNSPPRPAGEFALAVLPLQNFSRDAADVYVADGVTEALVAGLAQITGLHVTSRTSSMAYKGTTKSLPEISRELGVDLILEGSIVRDRDFVRITAQLIDARTDRHVWARSYDRRVRDLLSVQSDVVSAVVRGVTSVLSSRMGSRAGRTGVPDAALER